VIFLHGDAGDFFYIGLTCIGLFGAAVAARLLANRMIANEELACRPGIELADQLRINERVICDMQDGVLVIDAQGMVRQCNPRARAMLGCLFSSPSRSRIFSSSLAEEFRLRQSRGIESERVMLAPTTGRQLRERFLPSGLRHQVVQICVMGTVEAMLTGEALPVGKHPGPLPQETPLAVRRNMAFAGTIVVGGQGVGLVVATGANTETGRIAGLIAAQPEIATPLVRKMGAFAQRLLWAILGLAAVTFAIGLMRQQTAIEMFMAAVALAVGAIPEGLPATLTITLSIGVTRLA
jgi:hypothetical protein